MAGAACIKTHHRAGISAPVRWLYGCHGFMARAADFVYSCFRWGEVCSVDGSKNGIGDDRSNYNKSVGGIRISSSNSNSSSSSSSNNNNDDDDDDATAATMRTTRATKKK